MGRKILVIIGLPLLALGFLFRSFVLLKKSTSTSMDQVDNNQRITSKENRRSTPQKRKLTLIVRMRGEMANLLSHLAFAKGIQLWIHDHYPHIEVELIGERQNSGGNNKWVGAIRALQQCFPNLRSLEFHGGRRDPEFAIRRDQQKAWIGEENHVQHMIIDKGDSDCQGEELFCLNHQLGYLLNLLDHEIPTHILANMTKEEHRSNKYSLPFLIANQLASFDVLVDQYYVQLREWLAFDYQACCTNVQPHSDEVVFHLRNFRAEMRERNYLERGYEELTPRQLAEELLGDFPPNTPVTIASRGTAWVQPFLEALQKRGLKARQTPHNHTGVQDFCFLLKAQRDLVGGLRSTYSRWAVLLGQAKRVKLYSIDSQRNNQTASSSHYPWKQPELQSKIQYRVFQSEFDGT